MQKARAAIESLEKWKGLYSYLELVEVNRDSEPGVALDGAKSLIESIAKTVLADRGVAYDTEDSLGKLIKMAVRALPSFAVLDTQDADTVIRLVSGLESISSSIGTLRNRHGIAGHGHDLHNERELDKRLASLAIECADCIAGFLMDSHLAEPDGVKRLRYDDYQEFNAFLDSVEEYPVVAEVTIVPSRALFATDPEAYKEHFNTFISEKEEVLGGLEKSIDFVTTRRLADRINDLQEFFTDVEVVRIAEAITKNPQVYRIVGHGYTRMMYEWVCARNEVLTPELAKALGDAKKNKLY